MKFTKNVGITLLFAIVFALGVRLRDSEVQFVPQAHASDESLQSERSCDLRTLFGSYGIATTGSITSLGPVGLVADVGTISFDGIGNVSQTTTVSLNGTIIPSRASTGTYTVNSDCTGSITLPLPPPAGISQSNVVIVDNGKELRLINTGAGRVLVGNARKQ
jgi:hypothetical protein